MQQLTPGEQGELHKSQRLLPSPRQLRVPYQIPEREEYRLTAAGQLAMKRGLDHGGKRIS